MVETLPHPALGSVSLLGQPIKLSDTPGGARTAPPLRGEHTARVLAGDLGVDAATIDRLCADGVIERRDPD